MAINTSTHSPHQWAGLYLITKDRIFKAAKNAPLTLYFIIIVFISGAGILIGWMRAISQGKGFIESIAGQYESIITFSLSIATLSFVDFLIRNSVQFSDQIEAFKDDPATVMKITLERNISLLFICMLIASPFLLSILTTYLLKWHVASPLISVVVSGFIWFYCNADNITMIKNFNNNNIQPKTFIGEGDKDEADPPQPPDAPPLLKAE